MNGYGYGYNEPNYYYTAPRKSFFSRFSEDLNRPGVRSLWTLGLAFGGAMLAQLLLRNIYSLGLYALPAASEFYNSGELAKMLCEMLYSFVCVALPFMPVLLLLRGTGRYTTPLPLGAAYSGGRAALLTLAGLGCCFFGNIVSSLFMSWAQSMGFRFYSYYEAVNGASSLPESFPMALLAIAHTALIPALLEELVFRGIIMQPLRRWGDWFAIISSALLFSLVHANMTQIPFAFIAGVALGYCTVVSGSMWVGILIHFLNNLLSLVFSALQSYLLDRAAAPASAFISYGIIAVGAAALLIFIFKNGRFMRLHRGEYGYIRPKWRYFYLAPPLTGAIIALIYITMSDIVGFRS